VIAGAATVPGGVAGVGAAEVAGGVCVGAAVTGGLGAAGSVAMPAAIIITARLTKIGIISFMLPRRSESLLRLVRFSPLGLLLLLAGCSLVTPKFTRPNVTVISIEMRSGNLLQQNFAVKLNIQNPNDRDLPVRGLHVEMSVAGEQIATGVSDRAIVVPALGESEFDMTITANMALAVLKLANKMNQHADAIDYDLTGAASIDLPFLRNLPFHQSGTFPLQGLQ
jgi:LEA14-like dessication related protein